MLFWISQGPDHVREHASGDLVSGKADQDASFTKRQEVISAGRFLELVPGLGLSQAKRLLIEGAMHHATLMQDLGSL